MPDTKLEHIVGSTADPRLLMQRIVDEAQALIPCASGVAIVMDDGGRLIPVSAAGIGVDHIGRVAAVDSTLSGGSLASGEIVICDDISANERVDPGLRADPRAASLLSIPLRRDGQPIGLLVMVSSVCGAFTPEVACTRRPGGGLHGGRARVGDRDRSGGRGCPRGLQRPRRRVRR